MMWIFQFFLGCMVHTPSMLKPFHIERHYWTPLSIIGFAAAYSSALRLLSLRASNLQFCRVRFKKRRRYAEGHHHQCIVWPFPPHYGAPFHIEQPHRRQTAAENTLPKHSLGTSHVQCDFSDSVSQIMRIRERSHQTAFSQHAYWLRKA